jgi:hypothetical protein
VNSSFLPSTNVPILLIAWRRPDAIKAVIDAIRPHKPTLIFVACDGANPSIPQDILKVNRTREVINTSFNWPCKVHTLFSDSNLGCKYGPIAAINWFFNHVDEGIILEDDCVPAPDFIPFCTALLERYRNDTRVWSISGSNFLANNRYFKTSYYFSHYPHTWGWATWRRCWSVYDGLISTWPSFLEANLIHSAFPNPTEKYYWQKIWSMIYANPSYNAWDYQWIFTCISNSGLGIIPSVNLVSNIGYGVDATHTIKLPQSSRTGQILSPIVHPSFIIRDDSADDSFVKTHLVPMPSLSTRLRIAWHEIIRKLIS